jgi:hypothetical protein
MEDEEFAATASARSRELASRFTIANQSKEFVDIYEALADGREVELTEGLNPDYGRRVFPRRRVTATFESPDPAALEPVKAARPNRWWPWSKPSPTPGL